MPGGIWFTARRGTVPPYDAQQIPGVCRAVAPNRSSALCPTSAEALVVLPGLLKNRVAISHTE